MSVPPKPKEISRAMTNVVTAAASGLIVGGAEAVMHSHEHALKDGGAQAVSSFLVHQGLEMAGYDGLGLSTEPMAVDAIDALLTGVVYVGVQKLIMKREKAGVKSLLISAVADFIAKEGTSYLVAPFVST